ncbi:MAG: YfcE family phosphodiesterase [Desulfobacteraceae bacterium]|nr:YfcE family phosphodiesterase [Desulfobacteraceae bacterium]
MRIAILSDSHDHIPNLRSAVTYCNAYNVNMLIHCGDLISPFMLEELAAFGGAVHLIYGNNAGDQHLISRACGTRFPAITHHGVLGAVEAAGRRLAFTHYPELAMGLASRDAFDVVCCGHNHRYQVRQVGSTLLINPGELLGKDEQPGFCILECPALDVERVEVGAPIPPA